MRVCTRQSEGESALARGWLAAAAPQRPLPPAVVYVRACACVSEGWAPISCAASLQSPALIPPLLDPIVLTPREIHVLTSSIYIFIYYYFLLFMLIVRSALVTIVWEAS